MWFFDTGMIIFVIPAIIFAMYAQSKVRSAYERYSRIPSSSRITGAQMARAILDRAGLEEVKVVQTQGQLTDHYDPRQKVVRLSPQVYGDNSLAALGIAAHEVGHAIQHDTDYLPLGIRNSIVPLANLGSRAAFPLFFIGFIFSGGGLEILMDIGIAVFLFAVLFQAITLPVEFNASSRAMAILEGGGYLNSQELNGAKQVLSAAALTYVAALAVAFAQLFRLLLLRDRR
ncbi:MAG TPA: zinc metallopeptidase [Firmicutes bacterium]|jgi:Zn-dependent membrane protease YugP|nr:zinc metallopeptidase [Bacillota bacterium]